MRTVEQKLRKCPTCGGETDGIGLRDYQWVNDQLPGKVGGMDIDMVIERKGHYLGFEFKPKGASIGLGPRITFKGLVRTGIWTQWMVWDHGEDDNGVHHVEVGALDRKGDIPFVEKMTLAKLVTRITDWYEAADKGEL